MLLTFANKLTICRILSIPFFIAAVLYYSAAHDYLRYVALIIFLFAVITDAIDGYVARAHRQKTPAGAILDPLADKLLLISAFICLYKIGIQLSVIRFPIWIIVIFISRDVILLMGAMIIYVTHGHISIAPTTEGKASTFFQVITIIGMLVQWKLSVIAWYLATIFTVVSGIDYILKGVKVMNLPADKNT